MTNTIWKTGIDGDWATGADWTGGAPPAGEDAVINASGIYTVTVSSADVAHSLTLDQSGATLSEDSGGSLTLAGGLTLDAGTAILNRANSFGGGTTLVGGTLELGNAAALGTSGLTIDGGTLIGIANETISNAIATDGLFTMAAAHGHVVKFAGQVILNLHSGDVITFGQTGDDGTFAWDPLTLGVAGVNFSVAVNDGTLRDDNGSLNDVLSTASSTDVAAGAKIDIRGHAETIGDLNGSGVVTSTAHGGELTIVNGNFSGKITGPLALTVDNDVTLTNFNSYTGDTTIDGGRLALNGHGWITGSVVDNGTLDIDRSGSGLLKFDSAISGSGTVEIDGGIVALNGINTYSENTRINGGTLEVGSAAAVGSGDIVLTGGTLLGTVNEAISNQLIINGMVDFAAAHGTTLTLNADAAWVGNNSGAQSIVFGHSADDGVVVWDSPAGSSAENGSIVIAGGTLRAGDDNFQSFLNPSSDSLTFRTAVDQGGTLDVAGFATTIYNLHGAGMLENSGASTTVTINGGNFSGMITGSITLDIGGNSYPSPRLATTLGGAAANYGTINIEQDAGLILDSASASNIVFAPRADSFFILADGAGFTGSVVGFDRTDLLMFPTLGNDLSVNYSGNTTGGMLTVTGSLGSVSIALVGDFTEGKFHGGGAAPYPFVLFVPNSSASASAHADSFDFSATPAIHAAPEAGVTHLHGGHSANEIAFAHDVTEATHAHDLMLDHFAHGLFAHGHVFAEALG